MIPSRISGWPNTALSDGDPVVAGQRQLAATAEGVAAHGGDHEPGEGGDRIERDVERPP